MIRPDRPTLAEVPLADLSFDMFKGSSGDSAAWTSFTLTGTPNTYWPIVGSGQLGFLYRKNTGIDIFNNNATVATFASTMGGDRFEFLLTGTAGTGSPFAGNGTKVTVKQGGGVLGTYTLNTGMGTSYVTFGAFSNMIGGVDNLSLSIPSTTNTYATWAAAHAGGQGAGFDSNKNGIPNGIEYFMGATAANPATMPALTNTNGVMTWTWPYDSAAVATYKFQLSDDLSGWSDLTPPDSRITVSANPNLLRLTLPAGATKKFCRLVVTPAP